MPARWRPPRHQSADSEQTDPSGLIYIQARFYLPMYGRFASPDPARDQHFEETQSWNIYSYTQNQPTMRIDPDGQVWNYVIGAAIGAVADAGTQFVIGYMQTGNAMQAVKNINLTQVAISAVEGAATSGASAIKGTLERIAVKSAIAVVSSATKTAVDPNAAQYSVQQGVTDAVVSGVGGHLVEAGLNKVSQLTVGGQRP
ncbi:RHS repeat-associated core domain-containing protein [Mesoterricola sediminis]|uniref:RHS repeat-associated core domain-containing protein n=1 Tax=Mesoterricola sediminis TaxID=2927980 RepID=UPI00292F5B14|nr:RHS repeat-associated core domain-containing protein [Mesoterricola sediminis]